MKKKIKKNNEYFFTLNDNFKFDSHMYKKLDT